MASPQREADPAAEAAARSGADGATTSAGPAASPDAPEGGFIEGLQRTAPDRRESFGKAFIQIILATALFGGLLYFYWAHVQNQERVRELASDAKDLLMRDAARDLRDAEKLYLQALDLDGDHPYVVSALGLLNARLWLDHGLEDRKAKALSFIQKAEQLDVQKQERYGGRGLYDVGERKYEAVERQLVEVVNDGGRGPAIFEGLARAQLWQGKLSDARQSLRQAAESEWRNPRYNALAARLYLDEGELANAKSFVKKALDSNPDHLSTLVLEARVSIAREEGLKKAQENIDDVLSRPEEHLTPAVKAEALVARSELQRFEQKCAEAVATADEAIAIAPELAAAHLARGLGLACDKKKDAVASLQKSYELFPFAPRNYHQGALALLEAGRADDALQVMNAWGERVTKDSTYHLAYGNLLLQQNPENVDEARTHYAKANELNPSVPEPYFELGKLHQKAKEYDKAVDMFNKAVGIRERYAEVYESMGWLYVEQGHFNDALPLFAKALTFYNADRTDRKQMNTLRKDVGEALKKDRKFRSYYKPWMQESKDLIR